MTRTMKSVQFAASSITVVGLVLFAGYLSFGYSQGRGLPGCAPRWQPAGAEANERERMMLYVETVVDQYSSVVGKLPEQFSDLDKVPSFANADRLNGHDFKKNCFIHVRGESYALGCGGFRPSSKTLDDFLSKSGRTPGFYNVSGTEILYIPTPPCS
jgi:hypothetical protein